MIVIETNRLENVTGGGSLASLGTNAIDSLVVRPFKEIFKSSYDDYLLHYMDVDRDELLKKSEFIEGELAYVFYSLPLGVLEVICSLPKI